MYEPKPDRTRATRESGFALVLAILSLLLLTFLGLTLAVTTSTELQIATNYRWSQQALYNAEAGLEAAKFVLSEVGRAQTDLSSELPFPRAGSWHFGTTGAVGGPPEPVPAARPTLRDYELKGTCADRSGVGYGRVLTGTDGVTTYQGVSQFMGTRLNGAFTVWVRRELKVDAQGNLSEQPADNFSAVVTSEGIAPFLSDASAFNRANQARHVVEASYALLVNRGQRCQGLVGQAGGAPSGENFDPCSPLTAAGVAGAFGQPTADNGVR